MYVSFALAFAFFRATYLDFWGVVLCVAMMSISTLFYIIGGQYLVSKLWSLVPISGFQPGPDAVKFLLLPVLIALVGGFGEGARLYRTLLPRGDEQGLRAHRPRQGARRDGRCCSATCSRTGRSRS